MCPSTDTSPQKNSIYVIDTNGGRSRMRKSEICQIISIQLKLINCINSENVIKRYKVRSGKQTDGMRSTSRHIIRDQLQYM